MARKPRLKRVTPTAEVEHHWLDDKWAPDDGVPSLNKEAPDPRPERERRPSAVDRYMPTQRELEQMFKDWDNDN